MSSLRSILLHLDASPRSARRLALAQLLAAQHEAQVTALYAGTPAQFNVPLMMAPGTEQMLPLLRQLDIDQRGSARDLFDRARVQWPTAAPILWRELGNEALVPGVARHALCSDLLMLGQPEADETQNAGLPADWVASVLLASGRPALVVPYVDIGTSCGENVLVAWKATREAARALTAAIPFLQRARAIHLALADDALAGQADDITAYLRLHGVRAPIHSTAAVLADVPGDGLLTLAADVGADLLVMGCYSHSRARELMLGGASRTVLKSMTLPVLMAH